MDSVELQNLFTENPSMALIIIIILSIIVFFIFRVIIGKVLVYIAERTETKNDDILVKYLKPFRMAWLAPLIIILFFSYLIPDYELIIESVSLFFILWVSVTTINSLLNAVNEIYESTAHFSGVSIQGYIDIIKIIIILIGVILSISIITGESPAVLLSGLGALTAILLLVFRDTILSLVASIQITSQDLIKEGDWLEVPGYGADGDVLDISLHSVKIQNWDKTITVIPTYKMVDVAYKNWRGMQDSGGRRIKRSINIDLSSIFICDYETLKEFNKIDLLNSKIDAFENYNNVNAEEISSGSTAILNGPQVTNIEIFRTYTENYLVSRKDIFHSGADGMTFLIRSLAPSPNGLPIEIYVFTKTTVWSDYEHIQAQIFDHLIAAAPLFGLRLFQQPSGLDFSKIVGSSNNK